MSQPPVTAGCVDETTLVRFFAGDLPLDRLTEVEGHLDGCADCARLIEAAAPLLAGVSGPGRLFAVPAGAEPGQLVAGRYRIEGLIGQGASGHVLRARDELAGVPVAVKLLRSERGAQPALMQLFTRELRVARALNHPHVCRVFDLQVSGEDRLLVMELAQGSLRDELRSGAAAERPLPDRLADAEAIAAGLSAIHDAGIVHRDVKPENVLRLADGRLVLSDFGLATLSPLGSATRYVGTPLYMAPEVAAGEPATRASDLYALGLVLHELFFGRRPQWRAAAGRRVRQDPPRLRGLRERALARLVGWCLEELPSRRPGDARLVVQKLGAIGHGRTAALAAGPVCQRRVFLAGLSASMALGGGVVLVGVSGSKDPPAGALTLPPRSLLVQGARQASFSAAGLMLVNRAPGPGFELLEGPGGQRTLLSEGGRDAVLSPDGRLVAFITARDAEDHRPSREELYVMKRDTNELALVVGQGRGVHPSWSSDGKRLYYHDLPSQAVMALDLRWAPGRQPVVVYGRAPGQHAAVAPDGRRLAFGMPGRLLLVDPDLKERRWSMPGRSGLLASWSPDGRLLALAGLGDDPFGVWVLDVAADRFARVSAEVSGRPTFTPDGSRLTFDTSAGASAAIWAVATQEIERRLRAGLSGARLARFCRTLPDRSA